MTSFRSAFRARGLAAAAAAVLPGIAMAQLSCADLLTQPPLAGNPAVFSATSVQATTGGRDYCNVGVVWRDPTMVGSAAGYAPGGPPTVDSFQHIRLGIALPLNTNTGAAAWGGRLVVTAGGGAQGSVPGLTGMITMDPPAIGAGSDSGHGDANSGSGDSWGVINGVGLNMGKITDWAGGRSNYVAVRLAKQLAQTYYGQAPTRTYWSGFSGGGHMGWAQIMNYPEEYDGALIGAPAHHWQKFRLADSWDNLVKKKVAQQTTALTAGQLNAATAAAVAACDALDGVTDGFLADPRKCTWSAANHICGAAAAPAAPNCLDPIQAAGIDRMWDGPRNGHGKRIWHAYDRGVAIGASSTTDGSTAQVLRYAKADTAFDSSNLYEDQQSINLAAAAGVDVSKALTYEDAALLVSLNGADFIDDDFPAKLAAARQKGIKIVVYHGTADAAIHWRNDLDFYVDAALHFGNGSPDFASLSSWYRFFMVPGVGHSAQPFLQYVIDWTETGVAPGRMTRSSGFPVVCPFPQQAVFTGPAGGSISDAANYTCGGNLQTAEAICMGLRVPYKNEKANTLQTYGRFTPAACAPSKGSK